IDKVAASQAARGDVEDAKVTIASVEWHDQQPKEAYATIALQLAFCGELEAASETVFKLRKSRLNDLDHNNAIKRIVEGYCSQERWEDAIRVLREMAGVGQSEEVRKMMVVLTRANHSHRAVELFNMLGTAGEKCQALVDVVRALAALGKRGDALRLLTDEVNPFAATSSETYTPRQIAKLATEFYELDEKDTANELLAYALASVQRQENTWLQTENLCELGMAIANIGDIDTADRVFARAKAVIQINTEPWILASGLQKIAAAQAQSKSQAQHVALDEIRAWVCETKEPQKQARLLREIAEDYAQREDLRLAARTFREATDCARLIRSSQEQVGELLGIANAQVEAGLLDDAIVTGMLLDQAESGELSRLFNKLIECDYFEQAKKLLAAIQMPQTAEVTLNTCRLIAELYPSHAESIARRLVPTTDNGTRVCSDQPTCVRSVPDGNPQYW
ncbi:hypothetical protein OAS39_10520, partial [Pirellulales bacterium]|nr:hypothetical protein [Pirellulales bacterium]